MMIRSGAALLALGLIASSGALAQQSPTGQSSGGPARVGSPGEIQPQERLIIREYVTRQNAPRVNAGISAGPGAAVPNDIELQEFANSPDGIQAAARGYRYFRSGDDIVVVDPSTRTVVQIID